MKVGPNNYCVNPTNIVSVARSDKNYHRASDKPPKEPKDKGGGKKKPEL